VSALRRLDAICIAAAISLVTVLTPASSAYASQSIETFTTTTSTTEAGGHPDLETSFSLAGAGEPEAARNVSFNTPTGVFGNPNAITQCRASDYALEQCPSSSQAGLVTLRARYEGEPDFLLGTAPIYDLVPGNKETADFAFITPTLGVPIKIPVSVRTTSDYGLRFTVSNITQLAPLASANLTFWGFPAAADHDSQRFTKGSPGLPAGCPGSATTSCIGGPTAASITVRPLTDNPTTCGGEPLTTSIEVQTYHDPAHPSHQTSSYPATTECQRVTFQPVLYASPTTNETDSPSGLNIELNDPQTLGFSTAPSEIKSARVILPDGFTINPDAADGQTMCTDAQANFESEGSAECPDNAKIGTFSIGTPALSGRLEGSVYIGEPKPGDQYRLFLFASGFGLNAKLVGSVRPDFETGRLTVDFNELPQAPFENFQLHLFSGERSLMATPLNCTVYLITAEFEPWDTALAPQESTQFFGLNTGPHGVSCPGQVRPFGPTLEAGTSTPTAGDYSSFTLKLNREDGDQYLGKLNFTMPPGLTADLRGITYCPEASIASAANTAGRLEQRAPSCPPSSEIGTSNVAAGPGSHPFHAIGKVYLAGQFKGAPLSLVAVTPALAGPYDYGTVVVRVALNVDPADAHVVADSETVPSIIGGIPLRMRSIQVNIDKPNFMINPTNCSPMSVASQGIGDQGTVANFSSRLQAVNCATLPFKPKMTVHVLGARKNTRRAVDPSLQFDLTTRPGDANIRSLAVTLSNAFEIDQGHLANICSEKELAATQCAGRQAIGTATTTTPLLDRPLAGPVYAVSGSGGLPRLAFLLKGQVNLLPRADTETIGGGRLQTTVPVIPDAPIGHFHLVLYGGKQGYLVNTRDLCTHRPLTQINYNAQNGKTRTQAIRVKAPCGKRQAQAKRHAR
jgi:hypothetical protein